MDGSAASPVRSARPRTLTTESPACVIEISDDEDDSDTSAPQLLGNLSVLRQQRSPGLEFLWNGVPDGISEKDLKALMASNGYRFTVASGDRCMCAFYSVANAYPVAPELRKVNDEKKAVSYFEGTILKQKGVDTQLYARQIKVGDKVVYYPMPKGTMATESELQSLSDMLDVCIIVFVFDRGKLSRDPGNAVQIFNKRFARGENREVLCTRNNTIFLLNNLNHHFDSFVRVT
jgi:hypothetical protein